MSAIVSIYSWILLGVVCIGGFFVQLMLFIMLMRSLKGHFTADDHFGFEAAAWYWHFVDVVWIFLYINVYWWGSSTFGHNLLG